MDDRFTILGFGAAASSIVCVEGLMGWLYIEREHDVIRYMQVFEHLLNIALTPQESIELLSEIGSQYNSAPCSNTRVP